MSVLDFQNQQGFGRLLNFSQCDMDKPTWAQSCSGLKHDIREALVSSSRGARGHAERFGWPQQEQKENIAYISLETSQAAPLFCVS